MTPNDFAKSRGLRGWIDKRYQLTPLFEFLRHKEVPLGSHWMGWYYLGGVTMFFFIVQVITGVLLLMYFQPGEATAYESIRFLTTKVPFGWLIRSIHSWSAHLMIISLVLHMFSTMMLKAYRPPREITWVSGYLLFLLTLGFGFSGYLLPWNKLAYFATTVGTNIVRSVPLLGDWLLEVLRGGQDVTINTLYRFFAAHVVILPLAFVGLIGLHLLLIQRQGMAPPVGATHAPRGMKFFPSFALRDLLLWLACLMLLISLAVFLPYGPGIPGMDWELGEKADPFAPAYPGIKPEWYFLWEYQLLKEFPPHLFRLEGPQVCLFVIAILLGIWAIIPWLDRRAYRNIASPAFSDFGWGAILFLTYLTLMGWDIGAHGSADDPTALRKIAQVCACWTLAAGALVIIVRIWFYQHRWFLLSGAALLHVVLHGLLGVSYLIAGVISAGAAFIIIVALYFLGRANRSMAA
ncbi:MAG TPA: cytochrome bc complex cytochrome b subunit [Chthoniobacterales bacterium]|nr:cytochrome bc complex cytochrome b subunit [Chthoniobacterales bacterium]